MLLTVSTDLGGGLPKMVSSNKHIIIIGGGISGLALLHYLKQKYTNRPEVQLRLLEKSSSLGGTMKTHYQKGCVFEQGPDGFLNSKKTTLQFVQELDLEDELIFAQPESKIRHIELNNQLHSMPVGLKSFFNFKPLSFREKVRIGAEMFVSKQNNSEETVYEFGARRFGKKFADVFLDSLVTGIYGGDMHSLNVHHAFPKLNNWEQNYGSVIQGMLKEAKKKKVEQNGTAKDSTKSPLGQLRSFKRGMSQLVAAIHSRYKDFIQLNESVVGIHRVSEGWSVETLNAKYLADEIFLCVPAFSAAEILREFHPALSELLSKIFYAPIAVVGLNYQCASINTPPQGFGYLIPSSEKKEVLGVLFSSNIFPNRSPETRFLFRIMLGGSRNPNILKKSEGELIALAKQELELILNIKQDVAVDEFIVTWPKAIPQYDREYAHAISQITSEVAQIRNFHLVANYIGGVSVNDCIGNAWLAEQKSTL